MKGNVLIGQSGGPTAVINASLAGIVDSVPGPEDRKILGMRFGIEGFLQDLFIDLGRLSARERELLKRTPSSALGSCRHKLADEELPAVLEKLKRNDIRYFFLAGGNDTMDTVHRVEQYARSEGYELFAIGVPKTVDNDLFGTDHTPGYGSAARYTALSVLQAGQLARDMQRVDRFVIHQTVGRDSGWLASSSLLARRSEGDAPHLVYIPERPLSPETVVDDVRRVTAEHGYCSIVCGEGILWEDGTPVSSTARRDSFSNIEFGAMGGGSAALSLHQLIARETGYRGEFQITESLSMCAEDRVSESDRTEAYLCGREAALRAFDGESGMMVSMRRAPAGEYRIEYDLVPLKDVAVQAKPMPESWTAGGGRACSPGFMEYVRPLVGELPNYLKL